MPEGYPGQNPEQSVERIAIDPSVTVFLFGSVEHFGANCGSCNRPQPPRTLPDYCANQDCAALWGNVVIQRNSEDILEQLEPGRLDSMHVYQRESVRFEKPPSGTSYGLSEETTIETVDVSKTPYL